MASRKKKTVSVDFFDAAKTEQSEQQDKKEHLEQKEPSSKKLRFTVNIPEELIGKVKGCVYHTLGLTVSDFAEEAFKQALEKYEKKNGGPFPQIEGSLRPGRPLK